MKNMTDIICPWCGRELKKISARRHFASHGKSLEDYLIATLGEDCLKCKYPGCNNKVKISSNWTPFNTCCHSHQLGLLSLSGNHWYSHNNRKVDENGVDIIMKGVTERGNNPFSSFNRKLDKEGNDIIARNSWNSKLKNGVVNPITMKSGARDVSDSVESTIYIMIPEDSKLGYIKVGRSTNIESRVKSISEYIKIGKVIKFKSDELTAATIECEVHKRFCRYSCLNRKIINYSEWYSSQALEEIVNFISNFSTTVQRLE